MIFTTKRCSCEVKQTHKLRLQLFRIQQISVVACDKSESFQHSFSLHEDKERRTHRGGILRERI